MKTAIRTIIKALILLLIFLTVAAIYLYIKDPVSVGATTAVILALLSLKN